MRVLHLTDLHLTPPNASFDTLWAGVVRELPPAFDFVVISGDLTQAAQESEYRFLHNFLVTHLLDKVPDRDPARVILVPGNHDVDWKAEGIFDTGTAIADEVISSATSRTQKGRFRGGPRSAWRSEGGPLHRSESTA